VCSAVVFRIVICGAMAVCVIGCTWASDETKIAADFDEMSKFGRPGSYLSKFDYICLLPNTTVLHDRFNQASKPINQNFSKSLSTCGVSKSCCNLNSDVGIVGLVKDSEVRCVEVHRFDFLLDDDLSLCAAPSELEIVQQTIRTPTRSSERPRTLKPGEPVYRVRRKSSLRQNVSPIRKTSIA